MPVPSKVGLSKEGGEDERKKEGREKRGKCISDS